MIQITYLLQFLWVRNSGLAWLGGSTQFSHEFIAKILAGTAVTWRLDWAGRRISKVSHAYDQPVGSSHVGISMTLLECLHNMVTSFSQSKLSKRPSQKLQCLL